MSIQTTNVSSTGTGNLLLGIQTPVQLLDENGNRVEHPESSQFLPYLEDLDDQALTDIYRQMVTMRAVDAQATTLQRQGELHMWVPSVGQEGAQVGSGMATAASDYIFPTYREHAVALQRGVTLGELTRLFRGLGHSGWDPTRVNFHIYTLVLAAQLPHAVGLSMAYARDHATDPSQPLRSVLAYFGDGSSSEGDAHESMVFAASFKTPVVFFCQNNQWAISVPVQVQSKVPLAQRAEAYGFPGIRIDGNDPLISYAATRWALERAKNGEGPALIEAVTYRRGAHTTADDPTKYRSSAEEDEWAHKDPVARMKEFLLRTGAATEGQLAQIQEEATQYASGMLEAIKAEPRPTLEQAFDEVYAGPHALIAEERADFLDYQSALEDQA